MFWALLLIPAMLWWREAVWFVILASVYANVVSDWSAAEAADDKEIIQRLDRIERGMTVLVKVKAMKAYDTHAMGDIFWVPMDHSSAHLIVGGYLELLEDPRWQRFDSTSSSFVDSSEAVPPDS